MARQDDHARLSVRIPREIYLRVMAVPGEGSINAKIVNALDAATGAGSGSSLDGKIAALIERHVQSEVQARLRLIASQIGGAS